MTLSLCLATLLAASAYAGTVTLVNRFNEPVTFAVSQGSVYNPIVLGTVWPGHKLTVTPNYCPFNSDYHFMAYPASGALVTDCGTPMYPVQNVKVVAGWSGTSFGCGLFMGHPMKYCPYHHYYN